MLDFLFLGTSAATPTKSRNLSALAIKRQDKQALWLVDCGEGTQQQILYSSWSLAKIELVLITHLHGDHIFGLPGLLASRSLQGAKTALKIVGPKGLKEFLTTSLRLSFCYPHYPLDIIELPDSGGPVLEDKWQIKALPLDHGVVSFAYIFKEKNLERTFLHEKAKSQQIPCGPLWGKLKLGEKIVLNDGRTFLGEDFLGKARPQLKFIVAGDNFTPALLEEELQDTQVLIHEATYTEDVYQNLGKNQLHSTAKKVALTAEKTNLKNLILTHFSARYCEAKGSLSVQKIKKEASHHYQGKVFLAYDFAHFTLSKQAILSLED